jgi:hypothetical protein
MKCVAEWSHNSTFLDLGTSGERARRGRFTTATHCIGGWVGSRTVLNAVEKRKFCYHAGNRTVTVQPVARHCAD